ncbi:MAG: hypothetical protein NTY95_12070 [Bacteroidia bacterium]|nr:hypothetical protein [Bacteroidia bacterium]
MNTLVSRIGFWSAILVTIFLAISGITSSASIYLVSNISGFILTSIFLIVITCIYYSAPDDKKILGQIGLSFAIIYATMISMNYFIQLTFVKFGAFNTDIFSITDPQSMMMTIEVLGYFFMGLSTLFIAPIFQSGRLEKSIRWLFVFNGILGIGGAIGFALNLDWRILIGGLILWTIVMPITTALLAYWFKTDKSNDILIE